MEISSIIFWGALVVLAIYVVSIYNHLVRLKHNVSKAWSNIDVLLKQRHDEIPKLVETCKQYMKYEQDTLEKVMQARSRVAAQSASARRISPPRTLCPVGRIVLFPRNICQPRTSHDGSRSRYSRCACFPPGRNTRSPWTRRSRTHSRHRPTTGRSLRLAVAPGPVLAHST